MNQIMINNILFLEDSNEGYIPSIEVASGFEFDHENLCKTLSKHFTDLKTVKVNRNGGRPQKVYLLSERNIMLLPAIMKPNNKTIKFQAVMVDSFLELRKKLINTPAYSDNIIQLISNTKQLLEAIESQDKQIKLLTTEVQEHKPNTEVVNQIIASKNNISITQMGKLLGLGRKGIFEYLSHRGDIYYSNNSWVAKQQHINSGYFEEKVKPIEGSSTNKSYYQTMVTPKGQVWITKNYKKFKGELELL